MAASSFHAKSDKRVQFAHWLCEPDSRSELVNPPTGFVAPAVLRASLIGSRLHLFKFTCADAIPIGVTALWRPVVNQSYHVDTI
jgi:hypothetical protein